MFVPTYRSKVNILLYMLYVHLVVTVNDNFCWDYVSAHSYNTGSASHLQVITAFVSPTTTNSRADMLICTLSSSSLIFIIIVTSSSILSFFQPKDLDYKPVCMILPTKSRSTMSFFLLGYITMYYKLGNNFKRC